MKHKFVVLSLTLILFLVLAAPAFAQGPRGDQVVFGRDLELQAEEKIDGDVVVFGGNVTMPASSEIDGDLVLFGGHADINGVVTGDIGMLGGNIDLGESARVGGDISLVGGNANRAEGAVVEGQIQDIHRFGFGDQDNGQSGPDLPFVSPVPPAAPSAPTPPVPPGRVTSSASGFAGHVFDFVKHVVGNVTLMLALAAVSWVVAAFMPAQMKLVGDVVTESAPLSFVVGLTTMVIAIVVGTVLAITICLAFIPILAFLLIAIAILFGWIVIGQIIGERLLIATGQTYPNFVVSTIVGVTVLTIVANMPIISQAPCIGAILGLIGALIGAIVSLTGLGAVVLTRFGSQPYVPRSGAGGSAGPYHRPSPAAGSEVDISEKLSALERSEAELKAKIKAALAEAEAAEAEDEPKPADAPAEETPPDSGPDPEPDGDPDKSPTPEA